MSFPITRLRRLRKSPAIRNMVRETIVNRDDLIMPYFVCPGEGVRNPIKSMPGNYQLSVDLLVKEINDLYTTTGIDKVLLFGIPEEKDEDGSVACQPDAIVPRAIRALKKAVPEVMIVADVCNCEYTTHGHCGTIVDGDVNNDLTLKTLSAQSVTLAKAGADIIAPSDMMDGRVGAIRKALDENGFENTPIMAYSAKYASAFYGPFRDAAESAPQFGDRSTYQMDPANSDEALREVQEDINEGADMVMVKPALSYLDVINRVKATFNMPVVAYNVSGEFSMVKAAAQNGWIDEKRIIKEILTSIKRAGADVIITYHAKEFMLNNQ
ncbi:MAG: porphobilinogen synthase [Anaerophaga sp.]|uniref:porphobilinogen synthase n=1 Tax=Anaerophaga thermohalophila TaxID=177400 RepID=UPI000237D1D7|nr:porphobilinogen synthase [Anaerophaga thermohalophila]MDI3520993.1 porphobilinogen synthase [Anaerophaga sp.]MDK2841562.1 porphobilinogen synthase [Anaerophaga sp.]MDN5291396.1 porphobilinogen synthase [Anaerophaga sp.]